MSIWDSLIGRKTHCAGCGMVVPVDRFNRFEEVYCSEACRKNVQRISSVPPPPAEDIVTEIVEIPFSKRVE